MKLFKQEVINIVKMYTNYVSEKTNIPEEELYKLLLIKTKTKKPTITIPITNKIYDKENLSKDYCTFVNTNTNKKCIKLICDHDQYLCKKHYKLHLKKMEKNIKIKNNTAKLININEYINSSVKELVYNDQKIYIDYFNKIYTIDNDNNAQMIGNVDSDGKYIIK